MESGQFLRTCKDQQALPVQVVAMERMAVMARTVLMERQLLMHRQLQL
jgi:hypothetical protein